MSVQSITFKLDEHTVEIANNDVLIWEDEVLSSEPVIVLSLNDLRRMLSTADMLIKEPT